MSKHPAKEPPDVEVIRQRLLELLRRLAKEVARRLNVDAIKLLSKLNPRPNRGINS